MYELIFTRDSVVVRSKTKLPIIGEDWVEKRISYEKLPKMELVVTSIEPQMDNGVLKSIKFELSSFKEMHEEGEEESNEPSVYGTVVKLEPIRAVTNRSYVVNPPDGTKIRFDYRGVTYETTISRDAEVEYLNRLIRKHLRDPRGKPPSVNVYEQINAKYLDVDGKWQPLRTLKKR